MELTILIPHFREGRVTAYSISQLLKLKEGHDLRIIVIDNNPGDGSIKYIEPFKGDILILNYPQDRIQSHGVSFDFCMDYVTTDYFICMESDSWPTQTGWIDQYEKLAKDGCDLAGSILKQSGGEYIHPTGALFSKTLWQKAKKYCDEINYSYFPNMSMYSGFACHLMVHNSILDRFLEEPQDYIELASGYWGLTKEQMIEKREFYLPVVGPFHNGMNSINESLHTYGQRSIKDMQKTILLDDKQKLLNMIGMEPGQWLTYFAIASGANVMNIPCEIKWLPNRENQQQEYTINEFGIYHAWAGTSYLSMKDTPMNDVYELKKKQVEDLYNSLPEQQKIKE